MSSPSPRSSRVAGLLGLGLAAVAALVGSAALALRRHRNQLPDPAPEPPSLRSLAATNGSVRH